MEIEEIVSQVLDEQMNLPVDLLGIGHLFKLVPGFLPYQVVIGKKIEQPVYDFRITEANS